ncbi:hypothetical protein [Leptobacterium sp. I13]|uniref:hypothetical protein n=1 Tax=Leptobacterium meishanense TaxID=3128904 RepID=UPI0030EB34A8
MRYRKEYSALVHEQQIFNDLPKQLALLNERNAHYNSLLQRYQVTETSLQNNLLKYLNRIAEVHHYKLITFNEPHEFAYEGVTRKTYRFTVEGAYEAVLKLIYQLEQKTTYGEVIHVSFEKQKNHKTRKEYLQATIAIQYTD